MHEPQQVPERFVANETTALLRHEGIQGLQQRHGGGTVDGMVKAFHIEWDRALPIICMAKVLTLEDLMLLQSRGLGLQL